MGSFTKSPSNYDSGESYLSVDFVSSLHLLSSVHVVSWETLKNPVAVMIGIIL